MVILGSSGPPGPPQDPPGTPKKGCLRNKPSILPHFWPSGTPPGPLILGVPDPEKTGFTEQTLDFTPFWTLRTPWPWPGLFGKMGGWDSKNEVKSDISGTKHYFWWRFPDFVPLTDPSGPLKSWKISKNRHFLDPPKKWGVSTWFFSKMNELVCVNREAENLLSRIPIRDSTFFDEFFVIF